MAFILHYYYYYYYYYCLFSLPLCLDEQNANKLSPARFAPTLPPDDDDDDDVHPSLKLMFALWGTVKLANLGLRRLYDPSCICSTQVVACSSKPKQRHSSSKPAREKVRVQKKKKKPGLHELLGEATGQYECNKGRLLRVKVSARQCLPSHCVLCHLVKSIRFSWVCVLLVY